MTTFIAPGATLGVLGGGQLGRMFVHAAQQMGYRTVVLDPDPASPAGLVAHRQVQADYTDPRGLEQLALHCVAVTTEFENVPAQSLAALATLGPVIPAARAVAVCQDRRAEKAHFVASGVACAPHAPIETSVQLAAVDPNLLPGILKTARLGYDGKGQARVQTAAELRAAWERSERVPCVLEQRLSLRAELSVIVARAASGGMVNFPPQRNLHRDGVLAVTQVPAPGVGEAVLQAAVSAARHLAESLEYIGVLCVEFFVLEDGSLLANEMAPRPHNSGHYSLDACDVSQFELQVRTLTGAPLVAPRQHSPCVMLNLLGDLWFAADERERVPDWAGLLSLPGLHLHLYGKSNAQRGRKMGHLTVTAPSAGQADAVARQAAALLGIEGW